jgi:hypothetical protein
MSEAISNSRHNEIKLDRNRSNNEERFEVYDQQYLSVNVNFLGCPFGKDHVLSGE